MFCKCSPTLSIIPSGDVLLGLATRPVTGPYAIQLRNLAATRPADSKRPDSKRGIPGILCTNSQPT